MITKFKKKIKSLSHFIWLILLVIISIIVTNFYESNKESQYKNLKKTLSNFYIQKTFRKITSELENRYYELEHVIREGENYESINYLVFFLNFYISFLY